MEAIASFYCPQKARMNSESKVAFTLAQKLKISISILLSLTVCPAVAQTWAPTGAPSNGWASVACSADGTKLIAAVGQLDFVQGAPTYSASGLVYISTNSGTTWTPANLPYTNWQCVASSADGRVLAAEFNGVYVSTNYGTTWAESNSNVLFNVVVSADGSDMFVYAGDDNSELYVSTNSGGNWSAHYSQFPPITGPFQRVLACSADGSKLVSNAGAFLGGFYLFDTTNAPGLVDWNWTEETNSPRSFWTVIASSADDSTIIGVETSTGTNGVAVSTDSGVNWITGTPGGNIYWDSVACSADGTRLIAAAANNENNPPVPLLTSTNSGVTWITNNVPGATVEQTQPLVPSFWASVASAADGGVQYAAVCGGGIWISRTTVAPRLNVVSCTGGITLSWTIPSTNFILQQSSNLSAGNWTTVTNCPTPSLANLQEQLTLSPTNNNEFFRLILQ
jgi:hypothetical protein